MRRIEASKKLHLRNRNLLVLGSNEERGHCTEAMRVPLKVRGEGYTVVEAKGQEDGFYFEAVSQAKGEDEVKVIHPLALFQMLTIQKDGHWVASLLAKQMLANAGDIRQ